jgi:hypothetical protein
MGGGIDLGIGCFEKLQGLQQQQESRSVSREGSRRDAASVRSFMQPKHQIKDLLMRVPAVTRAGSFFLRAAADRLLRYSSDMFRMICENDEATWYG